MKTSENCIRSEFTGKDEERHLLSAKYSHPIRTSRVTLFNTDPREFASRATIYHARAEYVFRFLFYRRFSTHSRFTPMITNIPALALRVLYLSPNVPISSTKVSRKLILGMHFRESNF